MVKPKFISLFAGCGGSSLGYKNAGFEELLAIEWEDNAIETLKLNFPNLKILKDDILKLKGDDILKLKGDDILNIINLKKGELDLLDASPPCQGFSMAGKRKIFDSRNDLYIKTIDLIEEIQPKVFIIENVKGMIQGGHKVYTNIIFDKLDKINYNWKAKLMNSKYYNVPQSRERLIVIGIRKDLNKEPIFPKSKNKIITCKEALKNCIIDEVIYLKGPRIEYQNKLKIGENMNKYTKGKYYGTYKLNPNKPCPTITKTNGSSFGNFIMHWEGIRSISVSEAKRLCSFPDNFILIGNYEDKLARLGNAVMPKFMEEIAKQIKKEIFNDINP